MTMESWSQHEPHMGLGLSESKIITNFKITLTLEGTNSEMKWQSDIDNLIIEWGSWEKSKKVKNP